MKRERFSSVGGPSASTLLSNLWSSIFRTSVMLRSSRPRSSTMPVAGSGVPRTVTSARNEWPWISSLAAPSVVPPSAWAASNRNDFVNSHILKIQIYLMPILPDTECLVGLQAEPPLRMAQTIVDRARGVFDHVRSVHRLQRETFEGEIDESFRGGIGLRIDQLEFMALPDHEVGAGFRADADPVHALGRLDRTVGLDADFEAARMQRIDEGLVHLQQWFAAGQYHVMVGADAGPLRGDGIRKFAGRRIAAAQRAVGSDKIGVAKPARRRGAVLLAAAPEVAAGEPAKHRGPAGMGAFALQGQKDFLYRVTHWACSVIAGRVYIRSCGNSTATLGERKSSRIPRFGRAGPEQLRRAGLVSTSRQWTQRSPPLFKCGLVKAAARYEDGTWFFPCRSQGISSSAEWRRTACRSEWLDPATPQ